MAQSKAQNTYAQLGKYLMWCTRLSGNPDKNELAYICKMVKQLNQILQTIPMDKDETYMWIQIHCMICDYLEMLDRDIQDMFLRNCYAMMQFWECEELAYRLESSRFGFKDELLKKKIIAVLVRLDAHVNVLNHFFTEQVVCVIGQNAMAYIERAVDYLKELPEDDSNLLYLLNQSLIAMQETVWGHGVKVTKDGPEEILYIRDRARKYLGETRGYG